MSGGNERNHAKRDGGRDTASIISTDKYEINERVSYFFALKGEGAKEVRRQKNQLFEGNFDHEYFVIRNFIIKRSMEILVQIAV